MPVDEIGGPVEPTAPSISMRGLGLEVPPGWEGRIRVGPPEASGGVSKPVLHAATVPLLSDSGDYGSGVVEKLGPQDVFVSLVEFEGSAASTNLFPDVDSLDRPLDPGEFRPNQLQRLIPGQAGVQRFFTFKGRPFCLYVVIGSFALRNQSAASANGLLELIQVGADGG